MWKIVLFVFSTYVVRTEINHICIQKLLLITIVPRSLLDANECTSVHNFICFETRNLTSYIARRGTKKNMETLFFFF